MTLPTRRVPALTCSPHSCSSYMAPSPSASSRALSPPAAAVSEEKQDGRALMSVPRKSYSQGALDVCGLHIFKLPPSLPLPGKKPSVNVRYKAPTEALEAAGDSFCSRFKSKQAKLKMSVKNL